MVGPPRSIAPDPTYSDWARGEKISGVWVFMVVISGGGAAQRIRPLKLLGYGLDERAFDAIKSWKFKPATKAIAAVRTWKFKPAQKDGMPVPVRVPVELTFRLF
jgi:periplasmic protein TonB